MVTEIKRGWIIVLGLDTMISELNTQRILGRGINLSGCVLSTEENGAEMLGGVLGISRQ